MVGKANVFNIICTKHFIIFIYVCLLGKVFVVVDLRISSQSTTAGRRVQNKQQKQLQPPPLQQQHTKQPAVEYLSQVAWSWLSTVLVIGVESQDDSKGGWSYQWSRRQSAESRVLVPPSIWQQPKKLSWKRPNCPGNEVCIHVAVSILDAECVPFYFFQFRRFALSGWKHASLRRNGSTSLWYSHTHSTTIVAFSFC